MLGQTTRRAVHEAPDPVELAHPSTPARIVRQWVHEERQRFAGARVRTFVPILVQRAVAERAGRRSVNSAV